MYLNKSFVFLLSVALFLSNNFNLQAGKIVGHHQLAEDVIEVTLKSILTPVKNKSELEKIYKKQEALKNSKLMKELVNVAIKAENATSTADIENGKELIEFLEHIFDAFNLLDKDLGLIKKYNLSKEDLSKIKRYFEYGFCLKCFLESLGFIFSESSCA